MNQDQLILDYFENSLSKEDKINFDYYLQIDVDFAEEVAFQRNVKKAITLNERKILKEILQSFENKKNQKTGVSLLCSR
ncbi:hypothetical protein SAMN05444372_101296 [Flavobacterium micromati]|jgi:predicted DNA-binding protein YlxM (UPF0122 family)|uniref:Uncharacterized protein n=1 Tax=Flavobacterium micromati TaxID=229205 RepID=A0A1M5FU50_9FLAO|nr:hypothetical protein [Flavobacterium micromati]SHF95023.1 hypothetical protein SAMN05444372_101296 [Flavobacterium micromati]